MTNKKQKSTKSSVHNENLNDKDILDSSIIDKTDKTVRENADAKTDENAEQKANIDSNANANADTGAKTDENLVSTKKLLKHNDNVKSSKESIQPKNDKSISILKKNENSSDNISIEKEEKNKKETKVNKTDENIYENVETKEYDENSVFSEDISNYTKEELIDIVKFKKKYDVLEVHKLFQFVEPFYNGIVKEEKKVALKKFLDQGGEKDGFKYTNHQDENFYSNLNTIKSELKQLKHNRLVVKRNNTNRAEKIINDIREVLKGEETKKSIDIIRNLQGEWRAMDGFLPEKANELYKTYNALLDLYYDNRSIYFDLKDLDRRKNLKKKQDLCVKAEKLSTDHININTFKILKKLHLDYKQIGPIPRENNEPLWKRFKTASDTIHEKKNVLDRELAKKRDENLEIKKVLLEKITPFATFQHDKFSEWNKKTTEIKSIQNEWESTGALPKDKSKIIAKEFWDTYKLFFKNKSIQFKKEDHKRNENLEKKKALIAKVKQLKDSIDWKNTANILKKTQQDWKNIGPVDNKVSDKIFKQFRSLCNEFFDSFNKNKKDQEKSYDVNLKLKNKIIEKIIKLNKNENTFDDIKILTTEFAEIGFVPYKEVDITRKKYEKALADALKKLEIPNHIVASFTLEVDINNIKNDSNPEKLLNDKKRKIRSKVSHLEKEMAIFENNLSLFFRPSNKKKKNEIIDKKLGGFSDQIKEKEKLIEQLKRQLRLLNKLDFEEKKSETDK